MTEPPEVATTVSDLHTLFTLALPFVDEDEWSPEMAGVWLEAGGGVLTATATDRYAIGHARTAAFGQWPQGVLVGRRRAEALAGVLDALDADDPVTLTRLAGDPVRLRLTHSEAVVTVDAVRAGSGWTSPGWLKYQQTFTGEWTGESGPVALAGRVWTPILAAAEVIGEPMRIRVAGARRPVRVDIGDSFAAMAMPVAPPGERIPVPIGLPEARREPAAAGVVVS